MLVIVMVVQSTVGVVVNMVLNVSVHRGDLFMLNGLVNRLLVHGLLVSRLLMNRLDDC